MRNIPEGTQVIHHISAQDCAFYKEENGILKVWKSGTWVNAIVPNLEKMMELDFELEVLKSMQ